MLVSLGAALAALAHPVGTAEINGWRLYLVCGALGSFMLSVVYGIAANFPLDYEEPDLRDIGAAMADYWNGSRTEAARTTAEAWLKTLGVARRRNCLKAWLVFSGLSSEAVAFACLAAAVALILEHSS